MAFFYLNTMSLLLETPVFFGQRPLPLEPKEARAPRAAAVAWAVAKILNAIVALLVWEVANLPLFVTLCLGKNFVAPTDSWIVSFQRGKAMPRQARSADVNPLGEQSYTSWSNVQKRNIINVKLIFSAMSIWGTSFLKNVKLSFSVKFLNPAKFTRSVSNQVELLKYE